MKHLVVLLTSLTIPATVSQAGVNHTLDGIFDRYSEQYGVDSRYLKAICYVESNLKVNALVKNDNGEASYGICQVQLRTARHMGFIHSKKELMHPAYNIKYAAKYLAYNLRRYNGNYLKAIHAYNRGHYSPKREELNGYVKKVLLALITISADNK